jgi:hypothetical protein
VTLFMPPAFSSTLCMVMHQPITFVTLRDHATLYRLPADCPACPAMLC